MIRELHRLKKIKNFFLPPMYLVNWWSFYLDCFGISFTDSQVYKLRNGIILYSKTKERDGLVVNEIWGIKDYNPPNFEIKKNDIVVDIGGHRGYFSIFASIKAVSGKVFVFEPSKANYLVLNKNLKVNNCANVKSFQLAIAGKRGTRKLYISPDTSSGVSIVQDFKSDKRKIGAEIIRCIPLSDIFDICKIKHINFLKIDCEGAEHEILLNASRKDLARINKVSMEFHQIGKLKVDILKKLLMRNDFIVKVKDPKNTIGMLYARREKS